MAKTKTPEPTDDYNAVVIDGPTPLTTLAQYITLVHQIKREVQDPRPSLVGNYNSIVEIRDLIATFEEVG